MLDKKPFEPREALMRNLAKLIESNGKINGNVSELSKLTGITRQGLAKLLKGGGNPGLDTLLALSSALGATVSQLIGQLPLEASLADQGARSVPILLWQQAMRAEDLAPTKNLGNWDDWALTTVSLSPAGYALRVESKHLEPYFHFGDTLIIDPEVEPADDDYVIVQSENSEKARIKQIINDGNLWLHSLVQEHAPIELHQDQSEYKICGVVLQSIAMYRDE